MAESDTGAKNKYYNTNVYCNPIYVTGFEEMVLIIKFSSISFFSLNMSYSISYKKL